MSCDWPLEHRPEHWILKDRGIENLDNVANAVLTAGILVDARFDGTSGHRHTPVIVRASIGPSRLDQNFSLPGLLTSGTVSLQPSIAYACEKQHDGVVHRADKQCACGRCTQKKRLVGIERGYADPAWWIIALSRGATRTSLT
jgi:hypothetical protein